MVTGKVLVLRAPADSSQSAITFAMHNRAIPNRHAIWCPDPTDENPFGFIPNHWTTQPQLLPLNWDVRTVWASSDAGEVIAGWNCKSQVKTARVD